MGDPKSQPEDERDRAEVSETRKEGEKSGELEWREGRTDHGSLNELETFYRQRAG